MYKTLTVAELLLQLESVRDKSLEVVVEGCDCIQEAAGILVEQDVEGRHVVVIANAIGYYMSKATE